VQLQNMKRLVFLTIILFVCGSSFAHNIVLMVEDNGDGTIHIGAGVSTGESIAGSKIVLKDKNTGQPLLRDTIPESGEINVKMPEVPYTVTLDMGDEHTITKTGPLRKTQTSNTLIVKKIQREENKNKVDAKSPPVDRFLIILAIAMVVVIFGVLYGVLQVIKG